MQSLYRYIVCSYPPSCFGDPLLPFRAVRTLCTLYYDSIGRGEPGNFFPTPRNSPQLLGEGGKNGMQRVAPVPRTPLSLIILFSK